MNFLKSDKKIFTKVMVEIKGGVMVNITDLPPDQYEYFLDFVYALRIAYTVMKRDRNKNKSKTKENGKNKRDRKPG